MPIIIVSEQDFNVLTALARTTGFKTGDKRIKMAPTPGSSTQRRKANLSSQTPNRK